MTRTKTRLKRNKLILPRWSGSVYIISAILLLPWTVYLGVVLPRHHLTTHWDISWTGFDVGLVVMLFLTGLFAVRKSRWIILTSSTLGTLLLVDAWFDIMSEKTGKPLFEAIVSAVFLEVPLAIISYYIAHRALIELTQKS